MTPEQIAGLEALLEQATPGEWKARKKQEDEDYVYGFDWYHYSDQYGVVGYWTGHKGNHKEERWCLSEADARLIALAPTLARHVLTQQAQIAALAEDAARAHDLALEVERLKAENADLKTSVTAFCAPWAAQIAKDHGLPDGHLFAGHYDILKNAGARMVDFTRHEPEGE